MSENYDNDIPLQQMILFLVCFGYNTILKTKLTENSVIIEIYSQQLNSCSKT